MYWDRISAPDALQYALLLKSLNMLGNHSARNSKAFSQHLSGCSWVFAYHLDNFVGGSY